ncbi:hypothetical protein JOF53_006748 [Crossiella equi]|uniref:Secreted protein n=1 Tax=Crossiella equi TaxID=130796 RepID=A0ABS5AN85_9PSEU|nr:hypothetical protein [Crossiella equi]MBP2477876.1 hypothetical protein [Crossiella equi]
MKRLLLTAVLGGLLTAGAVVVVAAEAPPSGQESYQKPGPWPTRCPCRPGDSTIVLGMCGAC